MVTGQRAIEIFLGSPLTEEESQHMDEMARQLEEQQLARIEMQEQKYQRTETWGDLERYEAVD